MPSSATPIESHNAARTAIHLLSDLHLEHEPQPPSFKVPILSEPAPRILLLAGDISALVPPYYSYLLVFLVTQCVPRYEHILYVLGNHEFHNIGDNKSTVEDKYSSAAPLMAVSEVKGPATAEASLGYEDGLARARKLESETALRGKLVLLHRRRWDDPGSGLTVLGCTLWTSIAANSTAIVKQRVKDYHATRGITGWSTTACNQAHADDVAWLRNQFEILRTEKGEEQATSYTTTTSEGTPTLAQKRRRSVLVVTHHAPVVDGTSPPQYAESPWSCAFASDVLVDGVRRGWWNAGNNRCIINTWVFGHTHYTTDFMYEGIRVVSNQRGYVSRDTSIIGSKKHDKEEGAKQAFNAKKVIWI